MTRPRCALGRVVMSGDDFDFLRWQAWNDSPDGKRHFICEIDPDALSIEQMAVLMELGNKLYPPNAYKRKGKQ